MHVHPEKVTSTCSQRFAELDPHCPSMFAGACESFKDDADACRLSLTCLRRLSALGMLVLVLAVYLSQNTTVLDYYN